MFFIISKLLFFLTLPTVWLMLLLLWAIRTKNALRRTRLIYVTLALSIVLTNPFLSNLVFYAWEAQAVPMKRLRDTFDVGIVLGGFSEFDVHPYEDRLNLTLAANRLTDAIFLYKKGIIRRILVSGGDGRVTGKRVNEALAVSHYLRGIGIPDSAILLERQSRNTFENAQFSKKMIDSTFPNARCMLITSAFHIRRATGCFRKVGLEVQPFPAHFIAERLQWDVNSSIEPDQQNFMKWNIFIKEWLGYVAYWMKGYL